MDNEVQAALLSLHAYCRDNDWTGYEPYDALNSKIVKALPFLNFRFPQLVLTQGLKRSPINVRKLLLIPKKPNPKPTAVFLSSFLKLSRIGMTDFKDDIGHMIDRLISLRAPGVSYWCWGYSFPWQTRTVLVPDLAPNLVCTTFVANALLDAYEHLADERCLTMAQSAAEYILNELYWSDGGSVAGFAYPLATVRNQVHNANFLAAALLCRMWKVSGEEKFLAPALKAARHSAKKQQADGSWLYGEASTQNWIDNFHTGYNLCGLRAIGQYAGTDEFEPYIQRGFDFYKAHFLKADGSNRYFHDRDFPVDTHCVAQTIIMLLALKDLDPENVARARNVFDWTMQHMWDKRGFFYYQVHRHYTNRISYMRWTQAWMFLALAVLFCETSGDAALAAKSEKLVHV
jgi:hypothetical protein